MFSIGEFTFKTKAEARTCIRNLIAQTAYHIPIAGSHHRLLCSLAQRHPSAPQKIGGGIQHFTVRPDPYWKKTRQLILHRVDGSSTDISWIICLDGKHEKSDILGALRDAVAEQVIMVKREAFLKGSVQCPYTQEWLTFETSHVDHEPPQDFSTLVTDWLASEHLAYQDVHITDLRDHQIGRELSDPSQRSSWQRFHRLHAKLRVVSVQANLTLRRYVHVITQDAPLNRRAQVSAKGFRWSSTQALWMRGDQWTISDEAIDRMTDDQWIQWIETM